MLLFDRGCNEEEEDDDKEEGRTLTLMLLFERD